MRVIIVRHGKAQPGSPTGHDADRDLKRRGERQAAHLVGVLGGLRPGPERVIASPMLRARRTGEIVAEGLGIGLEIDDRLSTANGVGELAEVVGGCAGVGCVCLVGHNPTCEDAVAAFVDGPGASAGVRHRTGEAVVIDLDDAGTPGTGVECGRYRLDD